MNNQESAEGGSQPTANTSTVISAAKAFTGNSPERHAIIRHTLEWSPTREKFVFIDDRKSATSFEEIQKQLKKTLDHVEQKNLKSSFETLSIATAGVVDNCEHLGRYSLSTCQLSAKLTKYSA
jgi:hypothetical protein